MTGHFHKLRVADVREETPDAVSIAFEVPAGLQEEYRYEAGQYVTLRTFMDGEEVRRPYSICSGLDDGELRVAVKKVEGGRFSTFANDFLAVGSEIEVMPPSGRFTIPLAPDQARTYLGIAAGSGITPIMALVRTLLQREPDSRFVLLYGNRSSKSIIFREQLENLKDRFVGRFSLYHVLSREAQDVELFSGRIDADKIGNFVTHLLPVSEIDHAFLCGPGSLIEEARATLEALGLPHEAIHAELFTPADDSKAAVAAAATPRTNGATLTEVAVAEVTLDGAQHRLGIAEGETVIDAAQRTGLDLPFSCRGGMCCTCRAKLVEGEVDMAVNYSLEDWELKDGFVLTCQSRPTTDRLVLDYDAI